jgi:hypothetical protein
MSARPSIFPPSAAKEPGLEESVNKPFPDLKHLRPIARGETISETELVRPNEVDSAVLDEALKGAADHIRVARKALLEAARLGGVITNYAKNALAGLASSAPILLAAALLLPSCVSVEGVSAGLTAGGGKEISLRFRPSYGKEPAAELPANQDHKPTLSKTAAYLRGLTK